MPRIFEIFGYPLTDQSQEAETGRRMALCPFMGQPCDGGGNRYLSQIDLTRNPNLAALYPAKTQLAAGVCSIQLQPHTPPWIVCPRRLMALGRELANERTHQKEAEAVTLKLLGYPSGTRLGVWPEVKLKYTELVNGIQRSFDYTFDYILMPLGSVSQEAIEAATNTPWTTLRRSFEEGGYTLTRRDGTYYVENCPLGTPAVIEIMTASTSGGNKAIRSTIPAAFEDAILGKTHIAPGINYRQIWARMVSQLIVKSEIALHWGGKTLWVVQNLLVDYICTSTALNIKQFLSEHTSEVNLLSFSYGETFLSPVGVLELPEAVLYAGPMSNSPGENAKASFQDIVRAPICPPLSRLLIPLARRSPTNQVIVP